MYLVLHVPTGKILINPIYNIPWAFCVKSVADELVEPNHQANLINMFAPVLNYNEIDAPVSIEEFEIIYKEDYRDPNFN